MTEILRNSSSDGLQISPYPGDGGGKSRNGGPPSLPICVGCGFIIRDPFILRVSPNLEWHGTCLKCYECNQFLDESCTCFVKNGKAYCKRDYLKLFGIKCYRCQQPFTRNDLVMRARNFIYHTRCFSCFKCHKPLTPGDEFYLKGPDQSLLFCNRHDPETPGFENREFTELDPGANQSQNLMDFMQGPPGQERLLESIGSTCNGLDSFGDNSLTTNGFDGEINGRRHHKSAQDEDDEISNSPRYTQNDGRSTTPNKLLDGALMISSPSERDVSGATSYLDRMTTFCKSADAMASSTNGDDVGDDVIINDDDDLSSEDVNQMTSSPSSPVSHFQARRAPHSHGYRGAGLGRGAKQHHNHHHSLHSQQHHFGHRDHLHHGGGAGGSAVGAGDKVTRVRTVLNEKQLHTLRSCYNANPRPDALMKEQLVEMTGLSPRVIRVWFQNKRCKDKKRQILMKQITQAQEKGIANMHGIPMVASSPVRHEQGPFSSNYMEIQTYHSPWKALNDFALQNDIESQPFQQLI